MKTLFNLVGKIRICRAKRLGSFCLALLGLLFIVVSCKGPTDPGTPKLSVEPPNLTFVLNATHRTFQISNSGTGELTWTVKALQPWISVSPASGSQSGTVTVIIARSEISAGDHDGTIRIESNAGTENVSVRVSVSRERIWRDIISSADISSNWDCYDNNSTSGADYWGGTSDEVFSPNYAVWCSRRGSHPTSGEYDIYMDAWMILRSSAAVNISDYRDIFIRFWMKYDTERNYDTVKFIVLGNNGSWYSLSSLTWQGEDYTYRKYEVPLALFSSASPNFLRFGWRFESDYDRTRRGVYIDDIEVWGVRK